jgi:hypothetical protein
MREVICKFSPAMAEFCVKRIFATLFDPATASTTRYKLSQICSAIHALAIPDFDRLFKESGARIHELCGTIKAGELGTPTVKLLQSLTAERKPRQPFGGSESSMRRASVQPMVLPACIRPQVQVWSKTPDPHRE